MKLNVWFERDIQNARNAYKRSKGRSRNELCLIKSSLLAKQATKTFIKVTRITILSLIVSSFLYLLLSFDKKYLVLKFLVDF